MIPRAEGDHLRERFPRAGSRVARYVGWVKRTDRALAFAASFIVHADMERAAVAAGYSGDAQKLRVKAELMLDHPDVRAILKALRRKDALIEAARGMAAREAVSPDELDSREGRAAFLKRVVRGEVFETRYGKEGPYEAEPAVRDRLAALKLLGLMNGDYVERHEHVVTGETMVFVLPDNGRGAVGERVLSRELPANTETIADGAETN